MDTLIYFVATLFYGWLLWVFSHATFLQWMKYKNAEFVTNMSWITLEIKLPREINKSPAAMEAVLEAFYQGGGMGTWWDKYRKGGMLSWFSLEIVSIGGSIHFFIRTQKKFKNIIESYIYAQYPGIEVLEASDYTDGFRFDPEKHNLMGSHFVLGKEDFLPIKTYVDYGLDKDPKEEFRIDPLLSQIEFMSSLRPGEQIWYQILIRADKFMGHTDETSGKFISWKDEAKAEIQKMMMRKPEEGKEEEAKSFTEGKLTQGEKDKIKAIEKSISKNGFEVFMRGLYVADIDKYDGTKITSFMGMLKNFGNPSFNSFMPQDDTSFTYPWQDKKSGVKLKKLKEKMFKRYVLRTFGPYMEPFDSFSLSYEFHSRKDKLLKHGIKYFEAKPGKDSFVLNTEELATIFHFPGSIAGKPTFERISSTKSDAPSNLPI